MTTGICLLLASLFLTSCNRPGSDATRDSTVPQNQSGGVVLRADPNPVTTGGAEGKTTVTWDTGSNDVGEVYVAEGENKEKLFATGPKGSQEAPWIKPGSTEFRLYTQADHKLLAELTVSMR